MNRGLTLFHFLSARWRWATLRGAGLRRYQNNRAQSMVAWANDHSPFYRDHWKGHNLTEWQDLPTINKTIMMENFDALNTAHITRDRAMQVALQAEQTRNFSPVLNGLTVGLSSGTSGHRGLFLVSEREKAMWAGFILSRALHDLPRKRIQVAFFLRSNSNLYEETNNALIQFQFFDLMTPLEQAIDSLNHYQPDILVGPPSLLGMLAASTALRIQPIRILSVAEVLEPQDKQRLQAAFRSPIHEVYQCTEGLLAISCSHGRLHIQEDVVVIQGEALDPDTHRVTPIVTDLYRRTQPIIRYRLNDVLRLSSTLCTCGNSFRVIESIEGRQDDVCYFPSTQQPGQRVPVFPDTIRRLILMIDSGIEDYEAIQARPGHLRIGLSLSPLANQTAVTTTLQNNIAQILSSYHCESTEVEIVFSIEPPLAGVKRRRIKNLKPN
jgi:putative adenylate-forming enzyme